MRQRHLTFVMLMLILVLVVACQPKAATSVSREAGDRGMALGGAAKQDVAAPGAPMEKPVAGESYGSSAAQVEGLERMIIRTVNMTILVKDTDETLEGVRQLMAGNEGYISSSNRWLVGNQAYARVTVRVPAGSLEAVLSMLRGMAVKVQEENTSGEDVTEEYVDLKARLANLEATEVELRALLTEVRENRGTAEDILAVYRQLTEIRSQIESLKGRMQFLQQMTAMATINLDIRPVEAPQPIIDQPKWNPLVIISNALGSFVDVLQVFVNILIYLVIFSPFVLVPIAVLWLLVRWARRRQQKRRQAADTPPKS